MRILAEKKTRFHIRRARLINPQLFFRGASTLILLGAISLVSGKSEDNGTPREKAREAGIEYIQNFWNTANGLPQNSVNAVVQTRDGYLWIATYGGLARFDGVKFTLFDVADTEGITSNRILSLCESRDGGLWIGTSNAGLMR